MTATTLHHLTRGRYRERAAHVLLFFCGTLSILTTLGIVAVLLFETLAFFREVPLFDFLTDTQWTPLFADKHFGILPLVAGTVLTAGIAVCVATPVGLVSALYLSEYATERVRRLVKPVLEVLAGVPTVVYGFFALSPGIVIGMMIIPMVSSLSEDAMYAVPQSLREGAYALGSSKLQVAVKVVVPAAFAGIAASLLLGVSRAIGETMILAIAAGQQPRLTLNPTVPIETMTAYIVQVSLGDTPTGTIEFKTIFAVGMMLFVITLILNLLSQWLRERFREQYG